jgi:hypothetical protein
MEANDKQNCPCCGQPTAPEPFPVRTVVIVQIIWTAFLAVCVLTHHLIIR